MTLWTVADQAPLSVGFPRQGYGGRLPFPSPGDLPDRGIKPSSPALQADFFTNRAIREVPLADKGGSLSEFGLMRHESTRFMQLLGNTE